MRSSGPVYLGNSVYVTFNYAGQFELFTYDSCLRTNTIYLEPEIVEALLRYLDEINFPTSRKELDSGSKRP